MFANLLPAMPMRRRALRSRREESMSERLHFDLVAIGGGFAGLRAAEDAARRRSAA
jgi:NADPH-dependent 2,4-dienoyl-CoA reductase/sulfur reductase-like enzyme